MQQSFEAAHRLLASGRNGEAIALLKTCIDLNPAAPAAHLNLAVAHKAAGDLDGALAAALRALELAPGWPEALYNFGNLLLARGDIRGAVGAYRRALAGRPAWPEAWNALGTALRQGADPVAAVAAHEHAMALAPGWATPRHNLAVALQQLGREPEAIDQLRRALADDPGAWESHFSLGLLLLKQGDFTAGWREWEWRFANGGAPLKLWGREQPIWQGEPLHGRTLLLCAEQGHGAIIQFLRFVPRLAALGGTIFVEAPANLSRLVATCPGVSRIVAVGAPCDEADFQLPLMSVPRVLGVTLATLPADLPYLSPPAEPRPDLDAAFAPYHGYLKVGIAWSGNPQHPLNSARSCTPTDFATLAVVPGVKLFSLQYGDEATDPDQLQRLGIGSLATLGDFASTGALMARLDLIVTVDTYTAHLAGALGRPVWTLLHTPCDWRWMADRSDTPWYPGMRLFRQQRPGDWHRVFHQVKAALPSTGPAKPATC